jgi:hypothetical protein
MMLDEMCYDSKARPIERNQRVDQPKWATATYPETPAVGDKIYREALRLEQAPFTRYEVILISYGRAWQ